MSSWNKFSYNDSNNSKTSIAGISHPQQNWTFIPNGVGCLSNLVYGSDGQFKFIGTDGKFYSVDSAGQTYSFGSPSGGYSFTANSNIFLDSNNAYVMSLNGTLQEFDTTATYVTSSVDRLADYPGNGVVFLNDGKLLVLTSANSKRNFAYIYNPGVGLGTAVTHMDLTLLSSPLSSGYYFCQSNPAVYNNYVVAVLSNTNLLTDINAQLMVLNVSNTSDLSAASVVYQASGFRSLSSPAIDTGGNFIAVKSGNKIFKRNILSNINTWEYPLLADVSGVMSPSIDSHNNIYIIDSLNNLYSIKTDGTLDYKISLQGLSGTVNYPVIIDADDNIYFTQGFKLYKFDTTIQGIKWEIDLVGTATSTPILTDDGIFVPTDAGLDAIKNVSAISILGYNVYRSNNPNAGFVKLNKTPLANMTTFQDIGVADGVYYYLVKAVSIMSVESDEADIAGPVSVNYVVPSPPDNVDFTVSGSKLRLSWTAPSTKADGSVFDDLLGYDVYKMVVSDPSDLALQIFQNYNSMVRINPTVIIDTFYEDADVIPGYYYYYSVRARDVYGNSSAYTKVIRAAINLYRMVMKDGHNVVSFPFDDDTLHGDGGYMMVSEFINRIGSRNVSKILKWNSAEQVYEQYPAFDSFDVDKGYLVVLVTGASDTIYSVMGTAWPATIITLKEGVNCINLPLNDYTSVTQLVVALGGVNNVQFIGRYNNVAKKYEQYIPATGKGDFTELEGGRGYYVALTKNVTDKDLDFSGSPWI